MSNEWTSYDKFGYVIDVVAEATGIHVESIIRSKRRFSDIMAARKMVIMGCRKYYGMSYREIAQYLPWSPNLLMRHYHSGVALVRGDQDFEDIWIKVSHRFLRNIQQRRLQETK